MTPITAMIFPRSAASTQKMSVNRDDSTLSGLRCVDVFLKFLDSVVRTKRVKAGQKSLARSGFVSQDDLYGIDT